jgi:UbiD family decarboxylase
VRATDLRNWLTEVERIDKLIKIRGADWDVEIGCITDVNGVQKDPDVLLFDDIKGYPSGYRIITGSLKGPKQLALALNLPNVSTTAELMDVIPGKFREWESQLSKFPPEVVDDGPILENVQSGKDIDLFKFPSPKWHEEDGGRYIGTGDIVITRDPDTGWVNLGTYRAMLHDRNTVGIYIKEGSHGRVHYEKYHRRGERCPILLSAGHHPTIMVMAHTKLPPVSEYQFAGTVIGEPVKVIEEEVTGLPMPAESEIVLAGWCPPGKMRDEGPFGEWTGYYAGGRALNPVIEVEKVYHRNQPIMVGSPPGRGRHSDCNYVNGVMHSSLLYNELQQLGIPGIKRVWENEQAQRQFIIVSITQMYAGHSKQVGLLASQSRFANPGGRYVVVVDEDIDPINIDDVMWAISTRADPEQDIDITRRAMSFALDPLARRPSAAHFNSRAIIDACKPFEWKDDFPIAVKFSDENIEMVKNKWGKILKLPGNRY